MLRHRLSQPRPPERVVVLGATGFIGAGLTAHLAAHAIPVVPFGSADVDLTASDAANQLRGLLRSTDAVVFASAITRDRGRDLDTMMKNLIMGRHVAVALGAAGCPHVVYLSSDAVYGDDVPNPVTEATGCTPACLYGVMHFARERMLCDTLRPLGVAVAVLRPSIVYGADDTHGSYGPNRFFRTFRRDGTMRLFGQGEERRDHVHIDDVTELIRLCLIHRSEGVLNIATGRSTSFAEVAEMMTGLIPDHIQIESQPRVTTSVWHRHFDPAATFLAFPSFTYTPLEMGLAKTWSVLAERLHEPSPR